MVCTYRVRNDIMLDEERQAHTVYGIEAIDTDGEILSSFPDVFADRQHAECFADLCNDEGLSLMHLQYAVEDVLGEWPTDCAANKKPLKPKAFGGFRYFRYSLVLSYAFFLYPQSQYGPPDARVYARTKSVTPPASLMV